MRIQINPSSLLNLQNICEVLYKLHPLVLNQLVEIERSFGNVLGTIDLDNLSLEERNFLFNSIEKIDYSQKPEEPKKQEELNDKSKPLSTIRKLKEEKNSRRFHELRKYIQLDTYDYIPMKISVEVADSVIGRKVKELVEALEKTRAPEQFYLNKKEIDEDAYFAEGYGLTMNEEQLKRRDEFLDNEDVEGLKKLLEDKKLYP